MKRLPLIAATQLRCPWLAVLFAAFLICLAGPDVAIAQEATANPGGWVDAVAAPSVDTATTPQSSETDAAEVGHVDMEVPEALQGSTSALLTLAIVTLVPIAIMTMTSFTRILIVLALLRQGLGAQGLPPTPVLMGLSLALSLVVMAPTLEQMHSEAVMPWQSGQIDAQQAITEGKQPLRAFMFDQIEASGNWDSLYMLLEHRGVDTSDPSKLTRGDVDMLALVPAFVLSELKTAFLIGFRVYLPFLVIDLLVATLLVSMGALMVPPAMISLPFKLMLFVLVDGWHLVAGSLLQSFA